MFQIKTTVLDTIDSEVTSLTIDIHRNVLMMGTKGMRFIACIRFMTLSSQ